MKRIKLLILGGIVLGVLGCNLFGSEEALSPMEVGQGVLQNTQPIGELTKDMPVRQTLEALYDNLTGVSIYVATYGRQNNSNLTISIFRADENKVLKTYTIPASKLINNSWLLLPFEPVKGSKGKAFWVDIKGDGTQGNSPTVWMNSGSTFAESRGKLFVNAKERPGSLCFQVYFTVI
jgi:hypothetical protein